VLVPSGEGGSHESSTDDRLQSLDEKWIFNNDVLRRCMFIIFEWENMNLITDKECTLGAIRILTIRGFNILAKPIIDRQLQKVQLLLKSW